MIQERTDYMDEMKILRAAVDTYGHDAQTDMMIEEMSELTKALLKVRRGYDDIYRDEILEEMADVGIMLDQMRIIYGDESAWREKKIRRLEKRLEGETDE
jgi:hypothetical protein